MNTAIKNNIYTPPVPDTVLVNPIKSSSDWENQRQQCEDNLGEFHADIAAKTIHWFHPEKKVWFIQNSEENWHGIDVDTGKETKLTEWTPWKSSFDDSDAPFYRWFSGGLTNAAFNEVDRHVINGFGDEAAFWYEGDRWDPSANNGKGGPVDHRTMSRKQLLIDSVYAAQALKNLGLSKGDRIALNMPNILEQLVWTQAAKRLGIIYTPVFGGFSDKTLSDRIENSGASVVITADGASRNAEVVGFKEVYTDPALDNYISTVTALKILATVDTDKALRDRIVEHCSAALEDEITITRADVMREVGKILHEEKLSAQETADTRANFAEALSKSPSRVKKVIVVDHAGINDMPWNEERDVYAHELLTEAESQILAGCSMSREELQALNGITLVDALWKSDNAPVPVDAEYPLFVIYTSGSTGKPKGVVHVHGGYVAGIAHTMKVSFDAVPGEDRMWVIADPGWITGQAYMITASLAARIPTIVTEGSPVFPNAGRFSSIIERHKISIFKAGSTFLKSVMTDPQNRVDVETYDMSSLKVATFCAEPTSPSVQQFAMELMTPQYINSYWATEHGGITWTHAYGNPDQPLRADTHTYPLPWVFGDVLISEGSTDENGRHFYRQAETGEKGEVVITKPYPYLARTIWGDDENIGSPEWQGDIGRFKKQYFSHYKDAEGNPLDIYIQGDFARKYEDGSFSLHGRSDDVINVSGHRMGTEEIESAILKDKQLNPDSPVGNCIVIGAPHREKGLTPLAFLLASPGHKITRDDEKRLSALVREEKGAVAVPSDFIVLSEFPETRSGKYMRRFLKSIVLGEELGDTSTLRNPECLDEIKTAVAKWQEVEKRASEQKLIETTRMLRMEYTPVGQRDGETVRIATVIVSNPPVNALSERLLDELETALIHIERRNDIGAIVLAGKGSKSFIAGADVRQLLEDVHTHAEAHSLPSKAHAVANLIENMSKPVIAAVEGVALGGGCEMAMACHMRIGNRNTVLGQPEINLYLPPGYGGTQRLPRILLEQAKTNPQVTPMHGIIDALSMLISGRQIKGDKACAIGLLDMVTHNSENILSKAQQLAREAALTGKGLLHEAMQRRHKQVASWNEPSLFYPDALNNEYVSNCLQAAQECGRGPVAQTIINLVEMGFRQGFKQGLTEEIEQFTNYVMDPQNGGKKGIQLFMDKKSPALPSRPRLEISCKDRLIKENMLLPAGAAFYPGVTPIPEYQLAHGVVRDEKSGNYLHGDPIDAEKEVIIPVPQPAANQALVYVLASEVNYNDCWAISGIPISLFDEHDEDIHVTGSGGVGIVVALGEALQEEGRLSVGKLVSIYSGVSDLLDPASGEDPMFTNFYNQGYQTPDGSHQQFMVADGPQLFTPPNDISIENAGSYILAAGTSYRALFNALKLGHGDQVFVEGAATGTGAWAVTLGQAAGATPVGLVSSETRCEMLEAQGAKAVNRTQAGIKECFQQIPADPSQWAEWEKAGEVFLDAVRASNDGKLCTHALSHAGQDCFPRSFQALAPGGKITYFGASSGYQMTFMGKPGTIEANTLLRQAEAKPGEGCVIFYGTGSEVRDNDALNAIEASRSIGLRIVVVTDTDAERDFVLSLGYGDAIQGAVSIAEIKRRSPDFIWPETMPHLPDPNKETAAFKETVRLMSENCLKPIGKVVGKLLQSAENPKGQPSIIFERAHSDSLFITSMMVKAYEGRILYIGDMSQRRYSFYAPQVWMRQRKILMPSASIIGTHLCNAAEVVGLNRMINGGSLEIPETYMGEWEDLPTLHQAMWENRLPEYTGGNVKAVVNHALPIPALKTVDEVLAAWSEKAL
ncbi:MAG: AMP-binding protein [Neptuniibacter sp.]